MQVNATPIAVRYLPERVKRLLVRGVLSREQGRAAAIFVYNEQHDWELISSSGTNFPKGPRVQTSMRPVTHLRSGWSLEKPPQDIYQILHAFLIEEITFRELALRLGETGKRSKLHERGKARAKNALIKYRRMLHIPND